MSVQQEAGRKALRISPFQAVGIAGMENEEGNELLCTLVDFGIRPERVYFHGWQPNEMLIWDNWRMMHCACGVPLGEKRRMRRTTIAGDYRLGRYEQ